MIFKDQILQGIPKFLPPKISLSVEINRAPKRMEILSIKEKN